MLSSSSERDFTSAVLLEFIMTISLFQHEYLTFTIKILTINKSENKKLNPTLIKCETKSEQTNKLHEDLEALYGNVKLVNWSVESDRCFEGLYV